MRAPPGFRGIFRVDDVARAVYAEAAGIARVMPSAIAVPVDGIDVALLVRWAAEHGTPLIPRGSGSGMAGGAVGAGVIVDLGRLRAVGAVNAETRTVHVGAGAVRGVVDAAARRHGLRFPVDPSSGRFCTVGGMAATNAAGARTLRYGPTRRWVTALDCVFDDGATATVRRGDGSGQAQAAALRRVHAELLPALRATSPASHRLLAHTDVRKESSGYAVGELARSGELVDLLVGSEGTLALFTGVELALIPVPGATSSLLAAFPSLESAVEGALRARESGAAACELLDRTFLDVAALGAGGRVLPAGTEAALLVEIEDHSTALVTERARTLDVELVRAGATTVRVALDADTEESMWELRHAASPILSRLDPALRSMQFIEDAAVPPARLPEYVRGVRSALQRWNVRGVIFGHAGDAHVHVNPLVDISRADWRAAVDGILEEVTALVASLGGTLAGEHGDGRLRTPLLGRVWPAEAMEWFRRVKRTFDPAGILNPGVKVALAGQAPIADVKYDPTLAALPGAARRALDTVERERAYDRPRLDML